MKPAYILTEHSLTGLLDGKSFTINSAHPGWVAAINALKKGDYNALRDSLNTKQAFSKYTGNKVEVKNGTLFFQGEPIHSTLADKIMFFLEKGLPHAPLVNFLERLIANPSQRAVKELYNFLQHKHLPITDDGMLLAYKSVRDDWTDHHTGSFINKVGCVLSMKRNAVDDNCDHHCSSGFHAGSLAYASSFGGHGSRLLIVEIDPADVVSIPRDSDCQKLRTCKYKVVSEYCGPLPNEYQGNENAESPEDKSWADEDFYMDEAEATVVVTISHGNESQRYARDSKGRFAKQSK